MTTKIVTALKVVYNSNEAILYEYGDYVITPGAFLFIYVDKVTTRAKHIIPLCNVKCVTKVLAKRATVENPLNTEDHYEDPLN